MEKKKILVTDDAFEIRALARAMLDSHYIVIEASDGSEAIKKAMEEKPDYILMDIMMPTMDGMQATLQLKNNPKTKNIPVIMLTALSDSDSVLTSYDYGADHYLVKPFDLDGLLKAIKLVGKSQEKRL
jgi:DNA-binding response OmpR family regulator